MTMQPAHLPDPARSSFVPASSRGPARSAHVSSQDFRVSDDDRGRAISALGSHFTAGRLSLVEYEDRAEAAAAATRRSELDALFTDLPPLATNAQLMPTYSEAEIERVRRDGRNPKAAIMAVTTFGSIAASIVLQPAWYHSAVLLFLIPLMAILLYVAKIGPDSWHMPSPRKLERQRLRSMRHAQKLEIEQRKAMRRQTREELTHAAFQVASNSLAKRFKNR